MFHTFEGFENPARNNVRSNSRDGRAAARRASTVRACEQCRRRKIRCDGEQPCEACQWYKKADSCQYSDPRPSRRHVEKLSTTLDEYRGIVEKLFPSVPLDNLAGLSREKLLEIACENQSRTTQQQPQPQPQAPAPQQQQQQQQPPPLSPETSPPTETQVSALSPEDESLESLQAMPEESGDSNSRESGSPDLVATVSDDVNALSLSVKRPSTYLGISSVIAAMRVMTWIDPDSASYFSYTPDRQPRSKQHDILLPENASWHPQHMRPPNLPPQQPSANSMPLVTAYFAYFHAFIPLLDEPSFRETFTNGNRTDPRWMGLLNMVLALGSIAAYTADDTSHERYYQRARQFLTLESLGSAHIETVQTLALMGGYYLHYVSQPNLANSLMGAALRMASTLGLHKEFVGSNSSNANRTHKLSVDLRRRVWWSLFCLDTWGYMTLGRPSLGRSGPGVTAKIPHYSGDRDIALGVLPLIENSRFCKIATQVGDALAASPLVNYQDMVSLDSQLVEWYNNLPPLLKTHEPCPDTISTTRTIMRWRYQSQRILLHRPVLLSYAMRRIPYVALRAEERAAIAKCRTAADETIRDISSATRLNQMSGWNAVWFIFQAALVPLLGIFIADNTAVEHTATVDSCHAQVEIAMIALARMEAWSPTAKRTLQAVSRVFQASQRNREDTSTNSGATPGSGVRTSSGNSANAPPHLSTSTQDLNHPIIFDDMSLQSGGTVTTPTIDGSTTMWDYLTWSDSNLFTGYPGGGDPGIHNQPIPPMFGADEGFLKHLGSDLSGGGGEGGTGNVSGPPMYDHTFIPYQP